MTTPSLVSISIPTNSFNNSPIYKARCCLLPKLPLPITSFHLGYTKFGFAHQKLSKKKLWAYRDEGFLFGLRMSKKDGIFLGDGKLRREKRVLTVRFNNFDFNGGNGRKIDANTTRVLTNLGLAVGLTYLTVTGQLGWILDTIVSLWLFVIILLAVVFGAILWWAGQGMIESTGCPNCGNNFPFVKSLADESQACPFCGHSFSVEGDDFVSEPINFSSKRSTASGQTFDDFSPRSRKGKKNTLKDIIDIEAEVKDLD